MKLLIIDDDMRNIFALTAVLKAKSFQTVSAQTVQEGISLLRSDKSISALLLDIMMPETDGFEAIKMIRLDDEISDLPIIAVTAKAMDGDREKCIAAGANGYVSKPVDINKLLTVLSLHVNTQPAQRAERK
jgi:two-component system cell cycle response regulator DivK